MSHSTTDILIIYLIIINITSGILFAYDKNAAKRNRSRIAERKLHIFEMLGGVIANILLIYTLHHKNKKISYWIWTWLIMIAWIVSLYIIQLQITL